MKKIVLFLAMFLSGIITVCSSEEGGIIAEHLKFLSSDPDALRRFWENQKLEWLINSDSDSDDEEGADFSSMAAGSSELFGFFNSKNPKSKSQEYFDKIVSMFAVDTPQKCYLLHSSFMACKMEIEGEAEGYKGVVSRAIVKVGTDQVRSNFCAAIDGQMSILQSVKRSFDEKRKKDPEGTCYRMEEIDRQALKGCLSAMACLYVLDNQDETGLNSEDEQSLSNFV